MSQPGGRTELSDEEARGVVERIRPRFDQYASKYDERKYPPKIYDDLICAFSAPTNVSGEDIRGAMLWKLGHLGKKRIPSQHESLILRIQECWQDLSPAATGPTVEAFNRIAAVGGRHAYITVCFLLHLLRPSEVPIIDQFNFRAMNHYFAEARPGWRSKNRPSTFGDLETLSSFLSAIKRAWKFADPSSVPSERGLDRFLMMRGKALKSHKAPPPKITGAELPVAAPAIRSTGSRVSVGGGSISLPYGGSGATFQVGTLIQHLKESGRRYIIQGQAECRFSTHRKPQSLDFWLRRNFARNPDTKQAVNDVIHQLVSTGFFEAGEFPCPDSGRLCKGIRLIRSG
jgi:hypothetical protein